MLVNAISSNLGIKKDKLAMLLNECGIDPKRRAETISLEEFGRISDILIEEKEVLGKWQL